MRKRKENSVLTVVRKAKGGRICYIFLAVMQLCGLLVCFLDSVALGLGMAPAFCFTLFVTAIPVAYDLIWKICFSQKEIEIVTMFYRRKYVYAQLKNVSGYSTALSPDTIWLTFYDGKKLLSTAMI